MDTQTETKKRLEIAKSISVQLEGIVRGVLLGGSMGYGQNFSVTDKSDIDMVVVCDKEKVRDLERAPYFNKQVPPRVLDLFEAGQINLFWVTRELNSVEINSFVYETKGYEKFCLLKGGIKGYIPTKPQETQEAYGFDGKLMTFKRNVTPLDEGFLYEKPALANGKFWGGPPRSDFLIGSYVLYQQANFFDEAGEKVWNAVVKQLINEHGTSLDLAKFNILNTDFSYQRKPEKLPPEVLARVVKETNNRLSKLAPK